jgi:hypothetical protein
MGADGAGRDRLAMAKRIQRRQVSKAIACRAGAADPASGQVTMLKGGWAGLMADVTGCG